MKEVALLFVLILISSCSVAKNSEVKKRVELPDMIQVDYKHNIYKNNRVYLMANISEARTYEKTDKIECSSIFAEIRNTKSELTMRIKSDKAEINNATNDFYFRENVVIEKLDQDAEIRAQEIVLNYNKNQLFSEKPIEIHKKDGSVLKATSMKSDLTSQVTEFKDMDLLYYNQEGK